MQPKKLSRRKFLIASAASVGAVALRSVVNVPAVFADSGPTASPAQLNKHKRKDGVWSFGLISDTQWTVADDNYNPNTMAANIIKTLNQQFIAANVDLVIAVGDTVDRGDKVNIEARALFSQDLYNAGIGFYPLRGNHEATESSDGVQHLTSGLEFRRAFPQIMDGMNNNTPADITAANSIVPQADLGFIAPADRVGDPFAVGSNFSEPVESNTANNSASFAFEYRNATFMLLDQFNVNGEYYPSTIGQQQSWVDETLANRQANTHAFVFSHKNLLGGNHKDNFFGGPIAPTTGDPKDPGDGNAMNVANLTPENQQALADKQALMNAFIASMQANHVDVVVSGHDHHHYTSVVTSPDGMSKVNQLICASDSSKFYTPVVPASANDVPVQQDLGKLGYYICTVNGPIVTIDYYGDNTGVNYYGVNGGKFNFVKISTFVYTMEGAETLVAQGSSYAMTDGVERGRRDGFKGTSMEILSGTNSSTETTNYSKATSKLVVTGWLAAPKFSVSDTLVLSGMTKLTGEQTDTYTLAMRIFPHGFNGPLARRNLFGLMTKNAKGEWVKATDKNIGGKPKFVYGPWKAKYELGTYGIDPAAGLAWAVINYNSDFTIGWFDRKNH